MDIKFIVLVASFMGLILAPTAFAQEKISPFKTVPWDKKTTVYRLPAPYKKAKISVTRSSDKIVNTVVFVNGKKLKFPKKLLHGLKNTNGPSVSYKRAEFREDSQIKSFYIMFEYGYPKIFYLPAAGCKPISIRNSVVFTITEDYRVSRKNIDMIKKYNKLFPAKCTPLQQKQ
jgi:hypothetical protein